MHKVCFFPSVFLQHFLLVFMQFEYSMHNNRCRFLLYATWYPLSFLDLWLVFVINFGKFSAISASTISCSFFFFPSVSGIPLFAYLSFIVTQYHSSFFPSFFSLYFISVWEVPGNIYSGLLILFFISECYVVF